MDRTAAVDEFGDLATEIKRLKAQLKPKTERFDKLDQQIQSWFEKHPAEESTTVEGKRYLVKVSPRENRTEILGIAKVYRALGVKAFLAACKISLKAIAKATDEATFARLVKTERIGPRNLDPIAKAPVA